MRHYSEIIADYTNGSQMGKRTPKTDEQHRDELRKMSKTDILILAKKKYGITLRGTKEFIIEDLIRQTKG